MADKVIVRLVPKSRSATPRMATFQSALQPDAAKALSPDPNQAQKALVELATRNVFTKKTPENRLECEMSPKDFNDVFGEQAQLKQTTKDTVEPATHDSAPNPTLRLTRHENFWSPAGEIKIPDALKSTIEFAYVPRPVEYYQASFVPPLTGVYHLRLETVAQALNAAQCHRQGWTGRGVKIAMIDSGFARHAFFERGGYTLVRLGAPGAGNPEDDASGHGTGESANILAVAPDATLICVKQGNSAAGDIEAALAQNPDIMTCSWGWSIDNISKAQLQQQDPNMFNELLDVETAIAEAASRGVIVCFSGGNGHLAFPASLPQVLAIGGVTVQEDGALEASNYASSFVSQLYPGRRVPDFCGVVGSATPLAGSAVLPGHIMLPVPPNTPLDGENFSPPHAGLGWGIFSGTSAASPQVAAVIALMKSANPRLTRDDVRGSLRATAVDVVVGESAMREPAGQGPDLATGAGLIDAFRACQAAAALVPAAPARAGMSRPPRAA